MERLKIKIKVDDFGSPLIGHCLSVAHFLTGKSWSCVNNLVFHENLKQDSTMFLFWIWFERITVRICVSSLQCVYQILSWDFVCLSKNITQWFTPVCIIKSVLAPNVYHRKWNLQESSSCNRFLCFNPLQDSDSDTICCRIDTKQQLFWLSALAHYISKCSFCPALNGFWRGAFLAQIWMGFKPVHLWDRLLNWADTLVGGWSVAPGQFKCHLKAISK